MYVWQFLAAPRAISKLPAPVGLLSFLSICVWLFLVQFSAALLPPKALPVCLSPSDPFIKTLLTILGGPDPLINVPVNICAAVLGQATCNQKSPNGAGLVSIPVDACIAVLGSAKCAQSAAPASGSTAASNPGTLISVPINVCIAILGNAECSVAPSSSSGTVNIPIGLCIAVLGNAQCNNGGSSISSSVSQTCKSHFFPSSATQLHVRFFSGISLPILLLRPANILTSYSFSFQHLQVQPVVLFFCYHNIFLHVQQAYFKLNSIQFQPVSKQHQPVYQQQANLNFHSVRHQLCPGFNDHLPTASYRYCHCQRERKVHQDQGRQQLKRKLDY